MRKVNRDAELERQKLRRALQRQHARLLQRGGKGWTTAIARVNLDLRATSRVLV